MQLVCSPFLSSPTCLPPYGKNLTCSLFPASTLLHRTSTPFSPMRFTSTLAPAMAAAAAARAAAFSASALSASFLLLRRKALANEEERWT